MGHLKVFSLDKNNGTKNGFQKPRPGSLGLNKNEVVVPTYRAFPERISGENQFRCRSRYFEFWTRFEIVVKSYTIKLINSGLAYSRDYIPQRDIEREGARENTSP